MADFKRTGLVSATAANAACIWYILSVCLCVCVCDFYMSPVYPIPAPVCMCYSYSVSLTMVESPLRRVLQCLLSVAVLFHVVHCPLTLVSPIFAHPTRFHLD